MKNARILLFLGMVFISHVGSSQSTYTYSADSLFNLGNEAYQNDKLDEAIFYYERAKMLDPKAEDINVNLQLANEKLSTDIIEVEPFFLARWWKGFYQLLLPGGWKMLSILCLLFFMVLAYFIFLTNRIQKKNIGYLVGALVLFFFMLSILAGNARYNVMFHSPYIIVMGADQSLYEGPDLVSEEVKSVTGGNKLRILDEDGEWYKVSAMDSEQGWVLKKNVKKLSF